MRTFLVLLSALVLFHARSAQAIADPTWSDAWTSAPNSQGAISRVAVVGNLQIVAGMRSMDGSAFVSAHDLGTGALLWTRSIAPRGVGSVLDIAARQAGGFYVAGYRAADQGTPSLFVARFSTSGDIVWTTDVGQAGTDTRVLLAEAVDGGVVIRFETWPDRGVLRLSGIDGHLEHVLERVRSSDYPSQLALPANKALFLYDDSHLVRFDPVAWRELWSVNITSLIPNSSIRSACVDDAGNLLVAGNRSATYNAFVAKFAAAGGPPLWVRDVGGQYSGFRPDKLLCGANLAVLLYWSPSGWYSSELLAARFDGATGAPVWTDKKIPFQYESLATDFSVGRVFLLGADQLAGVTTLARIDLATGNMAAPAWYATPGVASGRFVSAGAGRVFVGANTAVGTAPRVFGRLSDGADGAKPVDLAPTLRNPVLGEVVPFGALLTIAVGATLEDSGPVLRIREYHNPSGAIFFEATEPFGAPWIAGVRKPSLALGSNGMLVVWGDARNGILGDSPRSWSASVMANYNLGLGTRQWSRASWVYNDVYTFEAVPDVDAVSIAPDNTPYVVETEALGSHTGTTWTTTLRKLDPSTGASAWSQPLQSVTEDPLGAVPKAFATDQGVVLAGDTAAGAGDGFALRGAGDGNVVWSRAASAAPSLGVNFVRAFDGDVVAGYSTDAGQRDFAVEKFAPADGTRRWQTVYGAANGKNDDARSLLIAEDGSIVAAARSGGSTDGVPLVEHLARLDGQPAWQTLATNVPNPGTGAYQLREAADGSFVFDAPSAVPQGTGDCLLCQNHVVRVAGASGDVLGWHHLGALADRGLAGGSFSTWLGGFDGTGGIEVYRERAAPLASTSLAVERILWPAFIQGGATASIGLAPAAEGDVTRYAFTVQIAYAGDQSIQGAVIDVLLPGYATASDVTCQVAGGGSCNARTVLSHVRQFVDLVPGGSVTIQGTLSFATLASDPAQLAVVAELPFRVGQLAPQQAQATVTVPGPLLRDSFE